MINDELKILVFIAIGLGVLFLFLVGEVILRRRKQRIAESVKEFSENDLTQYDDIAPGEAVILAWSDGGDYPRWHSYMQDEVRKNMPVLARALDRMVKN